MSLCTVLVALASVSAVQAGALEDNCSGFSMCGTALRATCKDDKGVAHRTSFDLNTCVGMISRDILVCQKGLGGLDGVCQQCALNGTALLCPCFARFAQNYIMYEIGLDSCLGVNATNGRLFCDGLF
ncbi:hypothetical protein AURDEDRAFT_156158 [Auricularia subglabra TFB-10046 SS5]|nr:hypothetical protein AURDEDRAFT_156158 [Auricularia subglabra TFB-10046 SS5]